MANVDQDIENVAAPEAPAASTLPPKSSFATRASVLSNEAIGKSKLLLLGGALAIAVLFFAFTAIMGRSPRKHASAK
jgi:hypothetical protein